MKRYAYLVDENVGNFQRVQGEHSGSHAIGVGCYIHICTQGIFLRPSSKTWHTDPRFLLYNSALWVSGNYMKPTT